MRSDFGRSFSRFHRCPQGQVGTTGNIEEAYKELFGIIIRKSYLAAARSLRDLLWHRGALWIHICLSEGGLW